MKCSVEKSRLAGEIVCPPNKSYTHRAVFLAALSQGKSTIKNVLCSADTNATIEACRSFGAKIDINKTNTENGDSGIILETATISKPITFEEIPKEEKTHSINAQNSGTTIRIAAGIAALSTSKTILDGDTSLQKRPMQQILDALETLGATCTSTSGNPPITVQGKIIGGQITIPGNISSQFISSLLICSPLTKNGVTINIKGELVSKPYLEATISSMQKFGVSIQTNQKYKKYTVEPQQYKETVFTVPPDYSSLALLLAAAVLVGERITIKITDGDDLPQGDKAFLEILEKLGVELEITHNAITVRSTQKLQGGTFDLSNTPDLLPPLAIMVLKSQKPISIINVKHARYKETDRIAVISKELKKLGIKIDEKEDGMTLEKPEKVLGGAHLDSNHDHRLFMAFCIAAMYVGDCKVTDPESVAVSYPDFVAELKKIGACIS